MQPVRSLLRLHHDRIIESKKSNVGEEKGIRSELRNTPAAHTASVYRDLSDMRVRTPWIEALRLQREQGIDPTKKSSTPAVPAKSGLRPKKMCDSSHRVVIPLAQDPWLLDHYLNAYGAIRLGRIFMDLDALCGDIAYKHTEGLSVTNVTAAVDKITINHPLKELCDLELSGHIAYASGRSSMEIAMQVAKAPEKGAEVKKEDILITCAFTMVAIDSSTKRPVAVSPIECDTDEERRRYALGEKNSNDKKALAKKTLGKQTPNNRESELIHRMWLKRLEYHNPNAPTRRPPNLVYMNQTTLSSAQIMQPQYRNRHNFQVFGGFLLRQTFELAYCCASSFCQSRPTFVSLDPSAFENPVPVGSVLYMTAKVAYTDRPLAAKVWTSDGVKQTTEDEKDHYTRVQIRVDSKVRSIEHRETKPTGQFNYTFVVEKDVRVMPQSYSEFMIWVDARRRAQKDRADTVAVDRRGQNHEDKDDGRSARVTE